MASGPIGGLCRPKSPTRAAPQQITKRGGGGEVVEEVTEETVFETFAEGGDSDEQDKVIREDLRKVQEARRKLITDIYTRLPVMF